MAFCDQLQDEVRKLFEEFVIPENVLTVLRHMNILTPEEIQSAATKSESLSDGARLLFDILVQKEHLDWFSTLQSLLCDKSVKLQHIADMMEKERKRFELQSANINYGATYSDSEPTTISALYIKCNRDVDRKIRPLFLERIEDPLMALFEVKTLSDKVLTKIDSDHVKTMFNYTGYLEAADLIFSRIVLYEGWMNVLLRALREIGLADLAEDIDLLTREIKEGYEKERSQIQSLYTIGKKV
ncbi:hypothetical protein BsWGS_24855 [Bradybaena similaris]